MLYASLTKVIFTILLLRLSLSRRIPARSIDPYVSIQPASHWLSEHLRSGRRVEAVSADDHLVTALPGLDAGSFPSKQYAGMLPVDNSGKSFLFYWLFEAEDSPLEKPLVIWLNGGPGCSSMDGLFLELGPLRLDPNSTPGEERIMVNPHGWHKAANMLFIDQPVGTGFAYTSSGAYCKTDEAITEHFHHFLLEFFRLHPQYTSPAATAAATAPPATRPLYLAGESHAGHYIPFMVADLLKRNGVGGRTLTFDLRGAALGNPWIDPFTQYDVSDFMHGLGLITHGQKNKCKEAERVCQGSLKRGRNSDPTCFGLLDHAIAAAGDGHKAPSMYDTRRYVASQSEFPPGKAALGKYLNRADVRAAIHASSTPHKWVECADPPYFALAKQDGKGATAELGAVLNAHVNVLVFVGQFDVICNHLGVERMLEHLDWSGRDDWLMADNFAFSVGGQPVGYVKANAHLGFMTVLSAGHMVPMDQPSVALEMMRRFVGGGPVQSLFGGGKRQLPMSLVDAATVADCEPAAASSKQTAVPEKVEQTPTPVLTGADAGSSGAGVRMWDAMKLLGGILLLVFALLICGLGFSSWGRSLWTDGLSKSGGFPRRGEYELASTMDLDTVRTAGPGRRPNKISDGAA